MKKINEYLPNKDNVEDDNIIDRFMTDPQVSHFVMENDLTHDTIMYGVNDILTFISDKDICSKCKGIYECKLSSVGFSSKLQMYNGDIELEYVKCRYNKTSNSRDNISAFYVPKKIFQATLDDFDMIGTERKEVHRYMLNFLKNYNESNYVKGLYVSGLFGSGKTYILATMANELAKKGCKVTFVYYPDLVRELKSAIGSSRFEEKIDLLKKAEILFLDDIGGETVSQFIRDEVLGPILQYRLLDQRPTFFSSNLKPKQLIDAFSKDQTLIERSKSTRIVERIRNLTEQFYLTEKPHIS